MGIATGEDRRQRHLSQEDRQTIRDNWGRASLDSLARSLGVTKQAVSENAHRMGLPKLYGGGMPRASDRIKPRGRRTYVESFHTARTSSFIEPPSLARLMAGR